MHFSPIPPPTLYHLPYKTLPHHSCIPRIGALAKSSNSSVSPLGYCIASPRTTINPMKLSTSPKSKPVGLHQRSLHLNCRHLALWQIPHRDRSSTSLSAESLDICAVSNSTANALTNVYKYGQWYYDEWFLKAPYQLYYCVIVFLYVIILATLRLLFLNPQWKVLSKTGHCIKF